MPRPKSDNPRTAQLNLHFTTLEIAAIKKRAEALGMRPVAFGRSLLLSGGKIATQNTGAVTAARILAVELSRLGNNLNQMVRHLHTTGDPLPADLEPLLADIRALLARVQLP